MVLVCISPVISDVEHFFTSLLAICVWPLGTYLAKSFAHLQIRLFHFFVAELQEFWMSTPTRLMLCKYFHPSCRLPFHSVDYVL
jgi:hypothetical protein